jgi:hypothetical protein
MSGPRRPDNAASRSYHQQYHSPGAVEGDIDIALQNRWRQDCRRSHSLRPPLPPPQGRKAIPYRKGSRTHKKPQPGAVGVSSYKLSPLSLARTSQHHVGQVSWLAARPYFLRLPKVSHLSGSRRFRSAHSCGAAMGLHHLPWSQILAVTSPTSGVCDSRGEITAAPPALSRTFLR